MRDSGWTLCLLATFMGCGDPASVELDQRDGPAAPDIGQAVEISEDTAPAVDIFEDTAPAPTDLGADTPPEVTPPSPDTLPPDDTAHPADLTDLEGPGPFPVDTEALTVAGFALDLHVPDGPGPFPAVVFLPGFQLAREHFAETGRHLASHGYLTAIPTFGDSPFAAIAHSTLADHVSTFLDTLSADPRVDPARLAAGGHSRGGKIAILAAIRDARIKASFNLDPVDSVGGPGARPSADNPSVTPELMGGFTIPGGFLGSAKGGSGIVPCAPVADNYLAYADHAAGPVEVGRIEGSGHNDFADTLPVLLRFACTAGDAPAATRRQARGRMVDFYLRHL